MEAEAPEDDSPRKSPVPSGAAFEPTPLLGDDAIIDDAPAVPMPRTLNAEEELVLTEEDMIAHPPPGAPVDSPSPARAAATPAVSADEESIGDFERDPGVPSADRSSARYGGSSGSADSRRVSIPIDLGSLPRSGRVTLTVEISIRVDSDEPVKKSGEKRTAGLDDSFTRDLEPIP